MRWLRDWLLRRRVRRGLKSLAWQWEEQVGICPHCRGEFPGNEPRPSCNECECCFCNRWCRMQFHLDHGAHDYSMPLEELG